MGGPSNINCMVLMKNSPDLDHNNIVALSRLELNRAKSILAHCRGAKVNTVQKVAVWGNINSTIYPDIRNAEINGVPALEIVEESWMNGEYLARVQGRC